jgi:hypothetical protein
MTDRVHTSPGLLIPEHTRNRQADLYAAISSTGVVAFFAVVLRILARRLSKAKYGLDDFLVVLGLVSFICKVEPCRAMLTETQMNLAALFFVAIWCL